MKSSENRSLSRENSWRLKKVRMNNTLTFVSCLNYDVKENLGFFFLFFFFNVRRAQGGLERFPVHQKLPQSECPKAFKESWPCKVVSVNN